MELFQLTSYESTLEAVWPRQPTDPSRWNWELLHIWKWEHSGRISELDIRSALTAIQWRARSSSLLRTRFLLFIDNQSSLAALVKWRQTMRLVPLCGQCTRWQTAGRPGRYTQILGTGIRSMAWPRSVRRVRQLVVGDQFFQCAICMSEIEACFVISIDCAEQVLVTLLLGL